MLGWEPLPHSKPSNRAMGRYEPRTVQSKRGHFKAIVATTQARKVEELEATLLQLVRDSDNHEELAGRPLDEDLMVVALVEACAPELRKMMEMHSRWSPTPGDAGAHRLAQGPCMLGTKRRERKTTPLTPQSSRTGEGPPFHARWTRVVGCMVEENMDMRRGTTQTLHRCRDSGEGAIILVGRETGCLPTWEAASGERKEARKGFSEGSTKGKAKGKSKSQFFGQCVVGGAAPKIAPPTKSRPRRAPRKERAERRCPPPPTV